MFFKTLHVRVDECQNQTANHILVVLNLFLTTPAIVVNEAVPCRFPSPSSKIHPYNTWMTTSSYILTSPNLMDGRTTPPTPWQDRCDQLLKTWNFSLTDFPPACWFVLSFLPVSPSHTLPFTRFVYFIVITTVSVERGICHGDMVRGRIARTHASREGDMSWGQLEPVLTDNLWCRGIWIFRGFR